MVERVPD